MIDIHSHLLPAIDDGARSSAQSAEVLAAFVRAGIKGVVLTPHVVAWEAESDLDDPLERREVAYTILTGDLKEAPDLYLGFEIMLDRELAAEAVENHVLGLAGSRYYLVEFPHGVAADRACALIADLANRGVTPIVAHPERYQACSVDAVTAWRAAGARVQVDATTLTRATGRGFRARQLLGAGLVDVMAADNHGDGRRLTTGVEFLVARGAATQAQALSTVNPEAIVAGEPLETVGPIVLKESLIDRLKRRVRG